MRLKVLSARQGDTVFQDWAIAVQSTNAILLGTTSFLDKGAMQNQLEAGRNSDLAIMCRNKCMDLIPNFQLWLEAV